jgi:hypothetical protein
MHYRLNRVLLAVGDAGSEELRRDPQLAYDWDWAKPLLFRALASPRTGERFPAEPRSQGPAPDSLGYWNSLEYLLTYDAGKPDDGGALTLMKEVWDADGRLDDYVAWAHEPYALGAGRWAHSGTIATSPPSDELTEDWERRIRLFRQEAFDRAGQHAIAGPWQLHLEDGYHISEAALDDSGTGTVPQDVTFAVDETHHRALLEVPSLQSWYAALRRLGGTLVPRGPHAWRVRVYNRQIGALGEYRRSSKTGIWFAGRHRFHAQGN